MTTRNGRTLTKVNMVAMARTLMFGAGMMTHQKIDYAVDRHRRRVRGTINGLTVFDMSRQGILLMWRMKYGK
jgi:uncharacterized protein involved in cysteine biosynthesis